MLVVDPWHWLTEDGHFLVDHPRLYRRMLRIARFIEYGGQVAKNEMRETLIECRRRPKGKPCLGLMWVVKTEDDGILANCIVCKTEEVFIQNWRKTEWADGMMEPVPVDLGEPALH
jgi:hypothetical protein